MASNAEQRKIEIIANGKKFNASMKEMQASVSILHNQLKKLPQGTAEWKAKNKEFNDMRDRLGRVKQEAYGTSSAMGKLTGMLGGMGIALGGLAILQKVAGWFMGASDTAKQFETSLSELKSITGASAQDMQFYSDEARRMGAVTTKSASEVADAFTIIGSKKPELLQSKEALSQVTQETIALAEAAKIPIPEAADALTQALNKFDLGAEHSSRVVNVLAESYRKGSVNINQTAQELSKFGGIANEQKISVEQSAASIQVVGKTVEESGTKIRNILLKLAAGADETNPSVVGLQTALDNLDNKFQAGEMSIHDFGTQNAEAVLQMVKNRDEIAKMTEAITGTSAAYEMAAENTDNYEGDLARFRSIVEDIEIAIGSGMNSVLRELVQWMTEAGFFIKELIEEAAPLKKEFSEYGQVFYELGSAIGDLIFTIVDLFDVTDDTGKKMSAAEMTIKALSFAIKATTVPIKLLVNSLTLIITTIEGIIDAGRNVGATFEAIKESAKKSLGGVAELIAGMWTFDANKIKSGFNKMFADVKDAGQKAGDILFEGLYSPEKAEEAADEVNQVVEQKETEQIQTLEQSAAEKKKINEKQIEERKKAVEKLKEAELKSEQETQKLRIELMKEGIEKTLAQIDFEHEVKLQKLNEQRQDIIENALLTEQEKTDALAAFEEEQKALEEEKKAEEVEAKEEADEAKLEKIVSDLEKEEELEQATLESQYINALDAENQRQQAMLDLQQKYLNERLKALQDHGKGETTQAIKIKNEISKIEKEKADLAKQIIQDEEDFKNNIRMIGLNSAKDILASTIDLLGEETKARKAAGAVMKGVKIGEVIISGIREIQGIWEGASQLGPILGPILGGIQTAAAVIRSAAAVRKIASQKFDKGGYTGPGMFVDGLGQLRDDTGFRVTGVAHEGEWYAPKWMVDSPSYANHIAYLEAARQRGSHAEGGFTGPLNPNAITNSQTAKQGQDLKDNSIDVMYMILNEMRQQSNEMKQQNAKMNEWATKLETVVSVLDIEEGFEALNRIRTKARIQ